MATDAEITTAIETSIAEGIASATVDGQSVSAMDPAKQIEAQRALAAAAELAPANSSGGKRSGWGSLRAGRAVPPGSL